MAIILRSELQQALGSRPDRHIWSMPVSIKNALVSLSFSFVFSKACQLQMNRSYL